MPTLSPLMNFLTGFFRRRRVPFHHPAVTSLCSRFRPKPPKANAKLSSAADTISLSSQCLPTASAPNPEQKALPSLLTTNPPESGLSSLIPVPSSSPRRTERPQSDRQENNVGKRKPIRRRVLTASTVEVPVEMASLVSRIHKEGYLKDKSFLNEGKYDPSRISAQEYFQGFHNALVKYGNDKQEIAKSLSGYHLKKIALLGCPSSDKPFIFAAKSLRSFFSVQEDTVCKGCKIKGLCRFANKKLGGKQKLALRDVLVVVAGYILPNPNHSPRKQLSAEIQVSVSKVLKEINNLTV